MLRGKPPHSSFSPRYPRRDLLNDLLNRQPSRVHHKDLLPHALDDHRRSRYLFVAGNMRRPRAPRAVATIRWCHPASRSAGRSSDAAVLNYRAVVITIVISGGEIWARGLPLIVLSRIFFSRPPPRSLLSSVRAAYPALLLIVPVFGETFRSLRNQTPIGVSLSVIGAIRKTQGALLIADSDLD